MALAAIVEERDLVAHFGHQYENYRRRVPMFVPSLRASKATSADEIRDSGLHAHHSETETWQA
jgi:hypothetical protein